MLNVLSGLQEGSRSVVTVSRSGPAGLTKGNVVATTATANTVALADSANANSAVGAALEYVFEDTTTQTSGKYTIIYGRFEAETDQYAGTPAIGAFLKPGTTTNAGLLVADTTPTVLTCAKVVDSYSLPINPTMTSPVGGVAVSVLRIRTL